MKSAEIGPASKESVAGKFITAGAVIAMVCFGRTARADETPAPASTAAEGSTSANRSRAGGGTGDAVIVFRSTKPGTVLYQVTGTSRAIASGSGGVVEASAASYVPLCAAPCEYRTTPGYYELKTDGGVGTTTYGTFTLRSGDNLVTAKPGSTAMAWVAASTITLGILAAVTSLPLFVMGETGPGVGLAAGGTAAIAGGFAMGYGFDGTLEGDDAKRSARLPSGGSKVGFSGVF